MLEPRSVEARWLQSGGSTQNIRHALSGELVPVDSFETTSIKALRDSSQRSDVSILNFLNNRDNGLSVSIGTSYIHHHCAFHGCCWPGVVNPATCVGVIQIKPSAANISKFQNRLREISLTYFFGRRPGTVMGVVVSDAEPQKKSIICRNGKSFPAYQFSHPKWCPVFILFSRRDGLYEPHFPAIEALVANISRMLQPDHHTDLLRSA